MAKVREATEMHRKYSSASYPTDEPSIRARIIHVLALYPKLNHTMLQVGLGTSFAPRYWRPVLIKMIHEGIIKQEEEMRTGPTGRYNMYTFLSLADEVVDEINSLEATEMGG